MDIVYRISIIHNTKIRTSLRDDTFGALCFLRAALKKCKLYYLIRWHCQAGKLKLSEVKEVKS